MKIRNSSLQKQKITGMFQHRSPVENKGNVPTLTDLINFLKTCDYFKKLINEYEDIEVKGLDIIKGKILVDEKTKFAKEHPELPGLEQVEKYLKFVTLPNEDGSESPVTIDGKPLIGIDIQKWVSDHGGLGDRSTHSKNILYTTKEGNYQISRAQHTRAGLLEKQIELPKYLLEAGLDHILVGSFFTDPDGQINVRGSNFSGLTLNYSNFNHALAEDTSWINAKVQHADLSYITLKGADLSYADYSYTDLIKAKIYADAHNPTKAIGTIFSFADMRGAHLNNGIDARGAKFISTNGQEIALQGANLVNADFSHADLRKAKIFTIEPFKTNFNGANFSFADLTEAGINGLDCSNVKFDHATLKNIKFIDIISLEGSSFQNADLSESEFFLLKNFNRENHLKSKYTNLKHTNFSNANLFECGFNHVNLNFAKLNNANLKNTAFIQVDLRDADLSGANFENASFCSPLITATQLAKAKNIKKIRYYKTQTEKLTYQQLCEIEVSKLEPGQRFVLNLIENALRIQRRQKQKAIQSKQEERLENKAEIKAGKEEVIYEEEDHSITATTQNADLPTNETVKNVGMELNPIIENKDAEQAAETQTKKTKKRKKKLKAEEKAAEPTQTLTNQQAIVKHGFFHNDTLNNINKYQCILKSIGALTVGLGCLWVMQMLASQTDEGYTNSSSLKL